MQRSAETAENQPNTPNRKTNRHRWCFYYFLYHEYDFEHFCLLTLIKTLSIVSGSYANLGGGIDIKSGVFTTPVAGSYMFTVHVCTHDMHKALMTIRY